MRAAWVAIAGACLVLYVLSIPQQVKSYQIPCPAGAACASNQITAADFAAFERAGISASFYAIFTTASLAVFAAEYVAVAFVIFWRKPHDPMALFTSLVLVIFGCNFSSPLDSLAAAYPALSPVSVTLSILSGFGMAVFFCVFPDGRFVPRWTRWLVPLIAAREVLAVLIPTNAILANLLFAELAVIAGVMIYRYSRVSNTVQRQQTKWVVSGSLVAIGGFGLLILVFGMLLPPERVSGTVELAARTGLLVSLSLIPLSIGAAILRARLWDIDILIRRTLVYGALTAVLALVYLGSVVLLEAILRGMTGESGSGPAAVISTLTIATLFTPLRRRIQVSIDRRFYRRKYDAERVLGRFGAAVRDEVDLAALTDHLVAAVNEAMQPEQVSLWVRLKPAKHSD